MSIEYNPFELYPIPRLFNYGKGEFEKYQDTFDRFHEMTYIDLVMNTSPDVYWVVFSDHMDYSGDQMALGIDADDNIYLSVYGYGSCEVCDPVLNCKSRDEVIERFESIRSCIVKTSTFKEMSEVIENKMMSDHILVEDWIGFLIKIDDKFRGELNVVLNDLSPSDMLMLIHSIYEENVETLGDFMRITATFCKIFPQFNLLEMDIYPQWLHAYLLITDVDELSEEILKTHKQQFKNSSFKLDFEEFRDSMLAVKLADILNECPDVVLAISSLNLTEYTIHSSIPKNIDDELFANIKTLIHEKLNLNKFNNALYLFPMYHKQKFHFIKTDNFDKLERFETTYSIRRNKFLELSSLDIESLKDNDDILFVRKQKGL